MSKIGTAHVEIKPVLDESALTALCDRIAKDIEEAVVKGGSNGLETLAFLKSVNHGA